MKTGHRRRHRACRLVERAETRRPPRPWWIRSRGQIRHRQPKPLPRHYPRQLRQQPSPMSALDHMAYAFRRATANLDRLYAELQRSDQ